MTQPLAGDATAPKPRRSGFGVRARLWGTIGVLALLPIASASVAWRAFQEFDRSLGDVVDAKLPQIEGALSLARAGDRLVLGGSGLVSAATQEAREAQQGAVTAELRRAADGLQQLHAIGLSEAATQSTEAALHRLQENTAAIDRLVGEALDAKLKMAALQQTALGLGDRFSRALEPISAEQRNAMSGFIAVLGGSPDAGQRRDATEGLQAVADATRALGRLGAANATLQSTIAQIPLAPDAAALDRLMQSLRRDTTTLAAALDDLDDKSTPALLPLVDEWDRLSKANPSLPRRRELDLAVQLQTLAATNKDLSNGLSTAIESGVQQARAGASNAAAEARQLTKTSGNLLLGVASVALFLAALLSWLYVGRGVISRLRHVEHAMRQLAGGDLQTTLPPASRDEIGAMVEALAVLKDGAIERQQLQVAQAREQQRAAAEKVAALIGMADTIETKTAVALQQIDSRTAAMTATAEEMSASAARTGSSAQSAASAAAQALANAQTVASAAEELSISIREIGGQVAQSTEVVGRAVAAGSETRATIEALNTQVERIGAVADMIGEIAAKTNLLALNATIEAARAGDAGKGFAVVASEVKALATQTARSTQEIAQHIGEVRSATGASVAAVARIEHTIGEINAIAGSIAAAVEQQGAATAEIARNVTETATAAHAMTSRTGEVSVEAEQTGRHATEVRENAAVLGRAVGELRHSVIRTVRTAAAEVDRRGSVRLDLDVPGRLTVAGQTHNARVADLSERGAHVHGGPTLPVGTRGTLSVDGVAVPLPFSVRHSDGDSTRVAFDLDAASAKAIAGVPERLAQRRAA